MTENLSEPVLIFNEEFNCYYPGSIEIYKSVLIEKRVKFVVLVSAKK